MAVELRLRADRGRLDWTLFSTKLSSTNVFPGFCFVRGKSTPQSVAPVGAAGMAPPDERTALLLGPCCANEGTSESRCPPVWSRVVC